MEEFISSSRTSGAAFFYGNNVDDCYGQSWPTAAASEDSGWTSYFDDDNYLQASTKEPESSEPAPRENNKLHRRLHHGDFASASTVSSANTNKNKLKVKKASEEEEKKRRPRSESELEDPLQDTASSPANATRLRQLQDAWFIAECEEGERPSALQCELGMECRRRQWDHWDGPDAEKRTGFA